MLAQVIGECLGTFILVLLGNGVVAANVLNKTKAQNSGWIMISLGWGLAVMIGVYAVGFFSPAYLNPAVVLGFLALGKVTAGAAMLYILAEFVGAMLGALFVWLHYYPYWEETEDSSLILASFSTGPAIRHNWSNFLGEALGTAVLTIIVISTSYYKLPAGFGPAMITAAVMAVGFSLGPTTGYAINPARDLGPRIMHAILPIKNKGNSDWGYAWIPVLGPIVGAVLAALLYNVVINVH